MRAEDAVKARPRHELSMTLFRPPALALVGVLARAGVRPELVVVSHCIIGLVAAALIFTQSPAAWFVAAVLLQVKTVLDNADGALARATSKVTELGRYLDTILDFVVNVALFVALAAHGSWALSAAALLVLTLVLSWDFNAEWLHKSAHHEPPASAAAPQAAGAILSVFRGAYQTLFEPQDRLVRWADRVLFRLAGGDDYSSGSRQRVLWSDLFSTAALVNLGLSTQLLVLGVCLACGRPFLWVYLVLMQGAYLVMVQVLRVSRFRRSMSEGSGA